MRTVPKANPTIKKGGVYFSCTISDALNFGLQTRVGSKLYLKAFEFDFSHEKEIPEAAAKLDWSQYLSPKAPIFINTLIDYSILQDFRNSMFLNQVLKDGISDFFSNRNKPAPLISKEAPKHQVFQFIMPTDNERKPYRSIVYFDLFGRSLSHRGYRQSGFAAPCRENVAAAAIMLGKFDPKEETFIDLMCGSGTFLYEAFFIIQNISPQILHLKNKTPILAFNLGFIKKDPELFESLKECIQKIDLFPKFKDSLQYGYDLDRKSEEAIENFRKELNIPAKHFSFKRADSITIKASDHVGEKLFLFANPPYAKRLGEQEQVEQLYYDLGENLKNNFKNHRAAILTGNLELRKKISLRTVERIELFNGNIESRLLMYNLF